jgi:hypothetical protein
LPQGAQRLCAGPASGSPGRERNAQMSAEKKVGLRLRGKKFRSRWDK